MESSADNEPTSDNTNGVVENPDEYSSHLCERSEIVETVEEIASDSVNPTNEVQPIVAIHATAVLDNSPNGKV